MKYILLLLSFCFVSFASAGGAGGSWDDSYGGGGGGFGGGGASGSWDYGSSCVVRTYGSSSFQKMGVGKTPVEACSNVVGKDWANGGTVISATVQGETCNYTIKYLNSSNFGHSSSTFRYSNCNQKPECQPDEVLKDGVCVKPLICSDGYKKEGDICVLDETKECDPFVEDCEDDEDDEDDEDCDCCKQIENLKLKINNLNNKIDNLDLTVDLTDIETKLYSIENKIDLLDLNQVIFELNEIDKQLNFINNNILKLENNISNVESTVNNRFEETNNNISNVESTVNNRFEETNNNISNVESTVNELKYVYENNINNIINKIDNTTNDLNLVLDDLVDINAKADLTLKMTNKLDVDMGGLKLDIDYIKNNLSTDKDYTDQLNDINNTLNDLIILLDNNKYDDTELKRLIKKLNEDINKMKDIIIDIQNKLNELNDNFNDLSDWIRQESDVIQAEPVEVVDVTSTLFEVIDKSLIVFPRSCPSPKPLELTVVGFAYSESLDYKPLCDFFSMLRPFVIGLGFISMLLIIVGGGKRG